MEVIVMEDLALKTRLSLLWLINGVNVLVFIVLAFIEPGAIDQIRSGEMGGLTIGPELLLFFAILLLVPLVMALLSQTLKDKANRWANIIIGAVYAVLAIYDLIYRLADQSVLAINPASGIVFSALIIWYAYKWSKG
jgi:hypothetical protein